MDKKDAICLRSELYLACWQVEDRIAEAVLSGTFEKWFQDELALPLEEK